MIFSVDDAYITAASQPDWQETRANWTTRWFTEDGCHDAGRSGGIHLMAHSDCWTDMHILNTLGWLQECIPCLHHPQGRFAIPRQVQQLISSVIGLFRGDACHS